MPDSIRHVLIAGATGLVGTHLLDLLLSIPTLKKVTAPTRTPLSAHPHLNNPVGSLEELLPKIKGPLDTVFCCLGTTLRRAGSPAAFHAVDHDLVLEVANRSRALGARHFLVISALGAHPRSRFFYNQVKGSMEQALIAQDWPQLSIARPSLLTGKRQEARLGEQLAAPLMHFLPGRWRSISASVLAQALWRLALEEQPGVRIVPSEKLQALGS